MGGYQLEQNDHGGSLSFLICAPLCYPAELQVGSFSKIASVITLQLKKKFCGIFASGQDEEQELQDLSNHL